MKRYKRSFPAAGESFLLIISNHQHLTSTAPDSNPPTRFFIPADHCASSSHTQNDSDSRTTKVPKENKNNQLQEQKQEQQGIMHLTLSTFSALLLLVNGISAAPFRPDAGRGNPHKTRPDGFPPSGPDRRSRAAVPSTMPTPRQFGSLNTPRDDLPPPSLLPHIVQEVDVVPAEELNFVDDGDVPSSATDGQDGLDLKDGESLLDELLSTAAAPMTKIEKQYCANWAVSLPFLPSSSADATLPLTSTNHETNQFFSNRAPSGSAKPSRKSTAPPSSPTPPSPAAATPRKSTAAPSGSASTGTPAAPRSCKPASTGRLRTACPNTRPGTNGIPRL